MKHCKYLSYQFTTLLFVMVATIEVVYAYDPVQTIENAKQHYYSAEYRQAINQLQIKGLTKMKAKDKFEALRGIEHVVQILPYDSLKLAWEEKKGSLKGAKHLRLE